MYPRSATQPSLIFNRTTSLSLHQLLDHIPKDCNATIFIIQAFLIQNTGIKLIKLVVLVGCGRLFRQGYAACFPLRQ